MGYSYTMDRRLCCDECGNAGAHKRNCPVRIYYPNGQSLPYCPAAALCATCYGAEKASGAWSESHAYCRLYGAERNAQLAAGL